MKRFHNSTTIALTAASFFALAASANASDLLDGLNDTAPAQARVDWSGVVIGGSVGYTTFNHELVAPGFSFDGISSDGLNGCAILGVQKQAYQFVYGIEGHGCYGDVSTDLTLGPIQASLDFDYSYAVYAKLGIARGPWLASVLGGYKWQHYELGATDDTIEGLSGGGALEVKLDDSGDLGLGLEGIYTEYEDQGSGLKVKPSSFDAKLRLTYTIN